MASDGDPAQTPRSSPGGDLPAVPDDASELALDVVAWQREQRARRRRQRWSRIGAPLSGGRYGPALPLVLGVLALSVTMGGLMIAAGQRQPPGPAARPLASTTAAAGQHGGLLPDVALRTGASLTPSRSVRPGVLALVPPGACDCLGVLDALAAKVSEYGVRLVVVADPADEAALARLTSAVSRGRVLPAVDATARLRTDTAASGLTVVIVAADGRIVGLHPDAVVDVALDVELSRVLG